MAEFLLQPSRPGYFAHVSRSMVLLLGLLLLVQGCSLQSRLFSVDARPLAYKPDSDHSKPIGMGKGGSEPQPAKRGQLVGNVSTTLSRLPRQQDASSTTGSRGASHLWPLMKSLTESTQDTESRIGRLQASTGALGSTVNSVGSSLNMPASVSHGSDMSTSIFIEAIRLARDNDTEYKQAQMQYEAEQLQARLSALSYGPRLGFSNRYLENENASRTTFSLVQPILSLDLIVALKESEPRQLQAQLARQESEYDLVDKVLAIVTALIQSREKFGVNKARIESLQNEANASEKEYQYGRGTLTDYRDAIVRLEQARAEAASIQADLQASIEELAQLTGKMPDLQAFNLSRAVRQIKLAPLAEYLLIGKQTNAQVIQSRLQERLTELEAVRSKGRFVPSLYYSASKSYSRLGDNEGAGLTFTLDMPIDLQAFARSSLANKKVDQARLKTEGVENKVKISIKRMHAKVSNGLTEVNLRLKAIEAARESLLATEKSFQGGVRSRLDVLDAVQTLYRVREEYIRSVLQLSRDFLGLQRMASQPVGPTVYEIERLLF